MKSRWWAGFRHTYGNPRVLAAVASVLTAAACYPGGDGVAAEDYDVVLTIHDDRADFPGYRTFAMPDTVLHATEDGVEVGNVSRAYDDLILELAAGNMEALGYTREADPQANGADLILLVSAFTSESSYWWTNWWGNWGYWPGWGYWPSWGPGWGWGYPPSYGGSVTIEQGTVLLTLIDPALANGEEKAIPVVWAGAVRGVLSGGNAEARITSGIHQAFLQSPYLGS